MIYTCSTSCKTEKNNLLVKLWKEALHGLWLATNWQVPNFIMSETYSKLKKKIDGCLSTKSSEGKSVWPLQDVNTNQVIHDSLLLNIDKYIFLNTPSTLYLKWTGSHLEIYKFLIVHTAKTFWHFSDNYYYLLKYWKSSKKKKGKILFESFHSLILKVLIQFALFSTNAYIFQYELFTSYFNLYFI